MPRPKPPQGLPAYDKTHVGRRFRTLRKVRGMTLTQWSAVLGDKCTPQKICNYEGGEDQVPVQYAAAACGITGASFDYIYRGMISGLPRSLLKQIQEAEAETAAEMARAARSRRSTRFSS